MGARAIKCSDGTWAVRFTDPAGQRRPNGELVVRTLRCAAYKPAAEIVASRINALVDRRNTGSTLNPDVVGWLKQLPRDWATKLSVWGLLEPAMVADNASIGEHLDAWEKSFPPAKARRAADVRLRAESLLDRCKITSLSGIVRAVVEQGLRDMEAEKTPAATVRQRRQAVRQFCTWCARPDVRRLGVNPLVEMDAIEGGSERERRALSEGELSFLLAWTSASADQVGRDRDGRETWRVSGAERSLAYQLVCETGLRANELRSLTGGQFQLEATRPVLWLKAPDEKNRRGSTMVIRPATAEVLRAHLRRKTPTAAAFALPPKWAMATMLRRDLADCRTAWLGADVDPQERKRREQSDWFLEVDHAGAVLDFHALRVTFITRLARAGVPLQQAQKLARHSDPKLTANIYSKLGQDDHAAAVDMLPNPLDTPSEALRATGTDASATPALRDERAKGDQVSSTVHNSDPLASDEDAPQVLRFPEVGINCPQLSSTDLKAADRIRTGDLRFTKASLYQLS